MLICCKFHAALQTWLCCHSLSERDLLPLKSIKSSLLFSHRQKKSFVISELNTCDGDDDHSRNDDFKIVFITIEQTFHNWCNFIAINIKCRRFILRLSTQTLREVRFTKFFFHWVYEKILFPIFFLISSLLHNLSAHIIVMSPRETESAFFFSFSIEWLFLLGGDYFMAQFYYSLCLGLVSFRLRNSHLLKIEKIK